MLKYLLLFTFISTTILSSNDKISLQLQWKHAFQFAGYYVAKEKGYYKNIGIELDIKEYRYGLNTTSSIESGKSTYGVGRPSIVLDKINGKEIVLLAAIFQSSPLVVLTTKQHNIRNIGDFKDKSIMTVRDTSNDAAINAMLKSKNLSLNNMRVLQHSFNVKDLINNKTNLMTAYIADQPYKLKQLGYEPIIFHPRDYGFDFYSDILFTSQQELINHPQRVENFRIQSIKGWEYAFDNIEETVDLILNKYNSQNISREALIYEAKELKKLAYYNTIKLGEIKEEKVLKILGIYNLMGRSHTSSSINNLVYKPIDTSLDLDSKSGLTKKQMKYLSTKTHITMCIDPDWMPFEKFDNNGEHIGISRDYFDIFQDNLNISIKTIKTTTWNQTLEFAKTRQCDIISMAMKTPMRKKYMNFTSSYLSIPLVLATKTNISYIDKFNTMKNKKVGIVQGYALTEILKNKYENLNIIEVKSSKIGLEKVATGELFGFIGSIADISYILQTNYVADLKVTGKFDERWELGVAVRNDDIVLLSIFEQLIQNLTNTQKQTIFNKYIAVKYEKGLDYTLLWQMFIGFIFATLILIFFLLKQNKLKKEIENLNKNLALEIHKEVTKSREKDKVLFQQSKLASMGEMISNIAHQWRQPLNRSNLNLAVIDDAINDTNIDKEMIHNKILNAQNNIKYMSDTIEDFANYFRPDKVTSSFNIVKIIDKTIDLLDGKLKNIQLEIKSDSVITAKTYENELLQVILVILNNAIDNFNSKHITRPTIEIEVLKQNNKIYIKISDNGGGVSKDNIDKIFDPYFTTKFKDEGTGIGLYMAKMIVEDSMHGSLKAIPSKYGITFSIEIERVNESVNTTPSVI